MAEPMYPPRTSRAAHRRNELAPQIHDAWKAFSSAVFAAGTLDEVTKQLIAVAVAHVTQCPYCIQGHTRLARRKGATDEQIMEAIWVAAEMRAGGAYAHSAVAFAALDPHGHEPASPDGSATQSAHDHATHDHAVHDHRAAAD